MTVAPANDPKRDLTCVEVKSRVTSRDDVVINFRALIDSGADVSLISGNIVRKLGLEDQIVTRKRYIRSVTGEEFTLSGEVSIDISIGPHEFTHIFLVQEPHLQTETGALLGTDFMNLASVRLDFSPLGVKMFIKDQPVPIVEKQRRLRRPGKNIITYTIQATGEKEEPPVQYVKSAEYRKINPWTAVVTRVILPDGQWPEHITLEKLNTEKGYIVEDQLVTTKKYIPSPKAKCHNSCTNLQHVPDCPTVHKFYAFALVFNSLNYPIYLSPGETVATVEPQYHSPELTKQINSQINILYQQQLINADRIKRKIDKKARKNKRKKLNRKARIKTAPADKVGNTEVRDHFCSEPTGVADQNLTQSTKQILAEDKSQRLLSSLRRENYHNEAHFLHLDPNKDREEYIRAYMKKHTPPIPLYERKLRVKALLDKQYPNIDPRARDLLLKYPEVVHLDDVPFVGNKTIAHRIIYEGDVFWNRQYKTPHILEGDIKLEIDRLLRQGIIRPTESEFNNAFLPVAKRDALTGKLKLRLCLDLRRLNSAIKIDRIPIADINDLLNKLDGVRYVSVIDCASGYLQIPLTEDSQKYTAFRYLNRAYAYTRMAFGLGSGPSSWIRCQILSYQG